MTLSTTGSAAHAIIDNGTTALDIAASTVCGNLTLTSGAAAGITDSGTVTVGDNLIVRTNARSGVIDMDTLEVNGTIALNTDGTGNATIINDENVIFANSAVGGDLSATATIGNIWDSSGGTLTITGASTFITKATGANINLGSSGNAFSGSVTMKAETNGSEAFGDITFVDSEAVKLHSAAGTNGDLFIDGSTDGAVGGTLSLSLIHI